MTTPSTPSPERPTTQDLARDALAEMKQATEAADGRRRMPEWARECNQAIYVSAGVAWLGVVACEALPAYIRRALYAEHLLSRLVGSAAAGNYADYCDVVKEAAAYLDALDSARQR